MSKHKIKYLRRSNRLYLKINRSEFSILMVKLVFTTEKIENDYIRKVYLQYIDCWYYSKGTMWPIRC